MVNRVVKECSGCRELKLITLTPSGHGRRCPECKASYQRAYRVETSNSSTIKYEKTKRGFLMRMYRNMQSRTTGVQKAKAHLYVGKELLDRNKFYEFAIASTEFHDMFTVYKSSGYDRKLAPTIDRVDSRIGYTLTNMEWVTHSENSRRGALSKSRSRKTN